MLYKIKKQLKKSKLIRTSYSNLINIYNKYVLTDIRFTQKSFVRNVGRQVNLESPKDFRDKLQWLKLYWYDPQAVKCADKYQVREIIKKEVGHKYLNELYAIYDSYTEIDIDKLPNSFVLKATHSSGYNFVCKDKRLVDWIEKKKELRKWFKINYFWNTREWVYKDIKPRIICEKYLSEDNKSMSLTDFKFYCFNGEPKYCQVIKDRETDGTIDFFDEEWNHMEFTGLQRMPNSTEEIPKPDKLQEMLEISRKLSKTFPFVRVDFYYVKGKVYFGELTFFPRSGFGTFDPPEWNEKIGDLLELPMNGFK